MRWEPMSVDEFARYRREEGMKLVIMDGIWWAEVRPFFYRPLFPVTGGLKVPPRWRFENVSPSAFGFSS